MVERKTNMKNPTDSERTGTPAVAVERGVRRDIFGYFEDTSQTPAHDPGLNAPCPVCAKTLERPVVTISLMPVEIRNRSYFFRAHKSCWNGISAAEQNAIESSLVDTLHGHAQRGSGATKPRPMTI